MFDWFHKHITTPVDRARPGGSADPARWRDAAHLAGSILVPLDTDLLRSTITHRVGALRETFPDSIRETDAPACLDAWTGDVDAMIPDPPLELSRILAASRRGDCTVAELVHAFEQDSALAAALLRHSSAPHYGPRRERPPSLAHAVEIIGTSGVENVVTAHLVDATLCRPDRVRDDLVRAVSAHLARCGPIARDLAPAFGVEPERGYTLGILHDTGKLILLDRLTELRERLGRELDLPPDLLSLGLARLHEPLGALAVSRWGFDEAAAQAIATHHRDLPEIDDPLSGLIYLVEKLDLAATRGEPFDLEAVWEAGWLNGDFDAVRAMLGERRQAA